MLDKRQQEAPWQAKCPQYTQAIKNGPILHLLKALEYDFRVPSAYDWRSSGSRVTVSIRQLVMVQ
jgi:hypothetical protein